jgi:dTMP kinase
LITLEGIDGCGKTTQARLLQEKLARENIPHLLTREPGGTAVGERVRQVLLQKDDPLGVEAELMLYMAARAELVSRVIRPALEAGKTVVCDRYVDSSIAYQGYGGGAALSWIRDLNQKVTGGLTPRLTLLMDLPVAEAARRRGGGGDRMEEKEFSFHDRVRRGYLVLARQEPGRVILLDALAPPEEQHRIIWEVVRVPVIPFQESRGK